MRKSIIVILVALLALTLGSVVQAAPVVEPGADGSAALKGSVRYRHFVSNAADQEVYIGVGDLGQAANRNAAQYVFANQTPIVFEYDATAGTISTTLGGTTTVSYVTGNVGPANYLQIAVTQRTAGATVDFNNVVLDGMPLGNFAGTSTSKVTGIDLSGGFTLTGTLVLNDVRGQRESDKLQIDFGYVAPPPPPWDPSEGVYLDINTQDVFEIDPRYWNTPMPVIQFGNRGSSTAEGLQINCFVDDDYATIKSVSDWSNVARYELLYDRNPANGNNERALLHSNPTGISIAVGQNWNFAVNLEIDRNAPAGTEIEVLCNIRQRNPNNGFLPLLDQDTMKFIVRNW